MAIKFNCIFKKLDFKFKAGTSRGVLTYKNTWFVQVYEEANPHIIGLGECGPLMGLSIDDILNFEEELKKELSLISLKYCPGTMEEIFECASHISSHLPSVRFGVETALLDLHFGGVRKYFENDFYNKGAGLLINGLVWMGDQQLMEQRLNEKIEAGFKCIKIKIGAIDFEDEINLLKNARMRFSTSELELRVDANGGFDFESAPAVLDCLARLDVHSIEQPIKAGQPQYMAKLCATTKIPIALDEELIGVLSYTKKENLLETIKPQFIILKPLLLGGFASCLEWIKVAESKNIGWWITSALESNVGLNAICQFASWLKVKTPQGLGTGGLYSNNIGSPLQIKNDQILYNSNVKWEQIK